MGSQVIAAAFVATLFSLILPGQCGECTVNHAPAILRFGGNYLLKTSDVDSLLASALGYTPKSSSFKGLTISSPFGHPDAAVIFAVHGGGARVAQEGTTYGLQEDQSLEDVIHDLKETVHKQSLRPTQFKHYSTYDSLADEVSVNDLPKFDHLKEDVEPDSTFLKEMVTLPQLAEKIEKNHSSAENKQDFYFLEVHSLADLVNEYGINSEQVAEAGNMLRTQLEKVSMRMRTLYGDSIVVLTAMMDRQENSRNKRSILGVSGGDYNLAVEYSENYPAIFNILLWGSIVLSLAVLATSVSMATMDPGRDSIIYRMTNPRMKKDQ